MNGGVAVNGYEAQEETSAVGFPVGSGNDDVRILAKDAFAVDEGITKMELTAGIAEAVKRLEDALLFYTFDAEDAKGAPYDVSERQWMELGMGIARRCEGSPERVAKFNATTLFSMSQYSFFPA